MRRHARTAGALLIAGGVLTLAWGLLVWQWQDPFTALYTHWQQDRLASTLNREFAAFHPGPRRRASDARRRRARRSDAS